MTYLSTPHRHSIARATVAIVATFVALGSLVACANPNFIGVQDYGTIYGNVIDAGSKPIGGALVSATGSSSTFRSNGDGSFRLPHISTGLQTVSAAAPGYASATTTVQVVKDTETSVGNITLTSTTNIPPH